MTSNEKHFSIFMFTINIQREVRRHPSWHLSAGSGSLTAWQLVIRWNWTPVLIFKSYWYQMISNLYEYWKIIEYKLHAHDLSKSCLSQGFSSLSLKKPIELRGRRRRRRFNFPSENSFCLPSIIFALLRTIRARRRCWTKINKIQSKQWKSTSALSSKACLNQFRDNFFFISTLSLSRDEHNEEEKYLFVTSSEILPSHYMLQRVKTFIVVG